MRVVIQNVRNFAELKKRIADIPRRHSELVFRGQTSSHGGRITPSFARLKNRSSRDVRYFHDHWSDVLGEALLKGILSFPIDWHEEPQDSRKTKAKQAGMGPVEQGAILQHYGERSHFVDVTTSLQVALWFAHHDWTSRTVRESRQDGFREHFCVAYKRTTKKFGYLFVIRARKRELGVLRPRHGEVIDISGLQARGRMNAQHAALIYCNADREGGDISRQVVSFFRFPIPLAGAESVLRPTSALFPPPDRDSFFDLLLSSTPYVPGAPRQKGQRRIIRLPEYYDTTQFRRSVLWPVYRARDHDVPLPFFHYALRTAKAADNSKLGSIEQFSCFTSRGHLDVRRAVAILNRSSTSSLFSREPSPHTKFDGATSVFFEYGPFQSSKGKDVLVLPLGKPVNRERAEIYFYYVELKHIRGIWIVRDGERWYARLYGGAPEVGLQITSGTWFRWKGDELVIDETVDENTAEDERIALRHVLGLLEGIARGHAKLVWPRGSHYCIFVNHI